MTGDTFFLWSFTNERERSRPYARLLSTEELIAERHLAPGSREMDPREVCYQFNNVNGGEEWLAGAGDPPWVARRTSPNPDDTDPEWWATFCFSERDATAWVESGQFDEKFLAEDRSH